MLVIALKQMKTGMRYYSFGCIFLEHLPTFFEYLISIVGVSHRLEYCLSKMNEYHPKYGVKLRVLYGKANPEYFRVILLRRTILRVFCFLCS